MKVLWAFVWFALLLSSCNRPDNLSVRLIVDESEGVTFDTANFTNAASTYLKENGNINTLLGNLEIVLKEGAFQKALESPIAGLPKASGQKPLSVLLAVKPYTNFVDSTSGIQFLFVTSRVGKNIQVSGQIFQNPMEIFPILDLAFKKCDAGSLSDIILNLSNTAKVLLVIDESRGSLKESDWAGAIKVFFADNLPKAVDFSIIKTEGIFPQVFASPADFLRGNLDFNHTDGYIIALRPLRDAFTGKTEVEALFAPVNADPYNRTNLSGRLTSVKPFIDSLKARWKKKTFIAGNQILYFPVKESGIFEVNEDCFDYLAYDALAPNPDEGQYLLIDSITGILPEGKILKSELTFTEDDIVPSQSKMIQALIRKLNLTNAYKLFFDSDRNIIRQLVLFEYITTGDIYVKLLFGPLSFENYQTWSKTLRDYGIIAEPKLYFPSDFR